ncbi:probable xyloglucan galactosyltransferase GT14 [Punica granatum]|uniref:Exostosin GT47 domain-containing protein n=2 Tax=Punica granatum TaxID=22663 RepID=A0A218W1Q9_PUNGR|nr:probable xyloglucan galactosyltransferase GT14 [Punica granatum]OWM66784.1 hypothetical protein CDL15_Pgr010437 [Punica granatum]PKI48710.1 hypothetical protein CRG98_030927 [Punica granatum]
MERPVIGKYRRGFLFVSVAAFVFWVALIYVFNRDVVVDGEIDIKPLADHVDQVGGSDAGGTSDKDDFMIHPNVVEKAEENLVQTSGSGDSVGNEEEVRQPMRNTVSGDDSNEEPDDRTGNDEEVRQPQGNVERRNDSHEEPVNSTKSGEEEVQQRPLRDTDSDEEPVGSHRTEDHEAQQPLRKEVEGSRLNDQEPVNSIRTDKEVLLPQRNISDGVGDGSKEHPASTDSAKAGADEAVEEEAVVPETDSCEGRYIFVQILPRRFHVDLLRNCKSLSAWTDMCETLSNAGLGPELPSNEKALSKTGWYSTNQFSLEVIFHNRMKQYKCLTNDSSIATAIYIPYYAGLDVAQFLWHSTKYRDIGPQELVKWLRARPEWKRMWGKDHFLVAGRISWDFRRETFNDSDWGTNLLVLPEVKRMTSLVLESTLIPDATDFAIPYPTYFHPWSDADVIHWQNQMKRLKRSYLFSFAGARRPNLPNSIRDEIIDQCRAVKSKCKLLECYSRGNTCYRPVNLIRLFQESVFCLQPQGDSYTRRSTFDSILMGCIPVFFHSGSAYDQYRWHLPSDHTKYSVFIPEAEVKKRKVNIEKVLSEIPRRKVEEMQQEVIELIPKIVYADPRSELETFEDAFDLTVKGVLERIKTLRREDP